MAESDGFKQMRSTGLVAAPVRYSNTSMTFSSARTLRVLRLWQLYGNQRLETHRLRFMVLVGALPGTLRRYEVLNARAGSHEWGYVEPAEAAWEILEETVEPFREDMKRHLELGLEAEALKICKGLVLSCYRLSERAGGDVLGWAPDFPGEAAGKALEGWYSGTDDPKSREVRR
jgi:hypothetical protein